MGQTVTGISLTLSLGAYTWYWLRQPPRVVHIPGPAPQDVALRTSATEQGPDVEEGPPMEGLMLLIRCRGSTEDSHELSDVRTTGSS